MATIERNLMMQGKSSLKQRMTMESKCISCKEEVASEHKAIVCDLCESWERVDCIRVCDRPSDALYEGMISCRNKALIFSCTKCRKKG